MVELWYAIVAGMLVVYVVMDGFDFGAGILHLTVTRNDRERREVLAAIGPYWDGNEVWLLAAGGSLFLAFPSVLAAGLSGFYFAIFLVLWCLIGRGIAIEFRSHMREPLWRAFWDTVFCGSSLLLAVLFGAALGNVIRGVPLDADGWFALTLFTHFRPTPPVGILDWYTVLVGVFAFLVLAAHGAAFLAWKTSSAVHDRARAVGVRLWIAVLILWPLITWATSYVNAPLYQAFARRPAAWLCAAIAFAGLVIAVWNLARQRSRPAFLGSCAFVAGLLAATAVCLYPTLLRSVGGSGPTLTAGASSVAPESLRIGSRWLALGLPLVLIYFAIVFRVHRGKAVVEPELEGS